MELHYKLTKTTRTTKVTGKGQVYFVNRYKEGNNGREVEF